MMFSQYTLIWLYGLFMVEAHGMEQLMLDSAVVQTPLTVQRHSLTFFF